MTTHAHHLVTQWNGNLTVHGVYRSGGIFKYVFYSCGFCLLSVDVSLFNSIFICDWREKSNLVVLVLYRGWLVVRHSNVEWRYVINLVRIWFFIFTHSELSICAFVVYWSKRQSMQNLTTYVTTIRIVVSIENSPKWNVSIATHIMCLTLFPCSHLAI